MAKIDNVIKTQKAFAMKSPAVREKDYLVDTSDRLIYVFMPSARAVIPKSWTWPTPSRSWIEQWKPVEVPDPLEPDVSTLSSWPKAGSFQAKQRGDAKGTLHVKWGGPGTLNGVGDREHFWGLYTFEHDGAITEYDVIEELEGFHTCPPGFLPGVWVPASVTDGPPEVPSSVVDESSGPIGLSKSGGP